MLGRTYFKVKGLNQERVINNLTKSVKVYNFKRTEYNLSEFEVDFINRKKTSKILFDSGLEIVSSSSYGVLSSLKRLLASYGALIAVLICILFYALQYSLILKIDVFGATKNNKTQITQFVNDNLDSRLKYKIDTDKIEKLIKGNFKDVSSVSVAIVGQSLIININPAVLPQEMEESDAIISNFEGLVTQINLIQGTLAIEVGDVIKKGDVLVYPYIIDSQGEKRDVVPRADIYADIWICGEECHYDYLIETKRTGKKIVKNEIYFMSILIYSSNFEQKFKEYEIEEHYLDISKNNILPLKRRTLTYYETETNEIISDFNEIKDKIIDKARAKALIFLLENEIIKEENYTIREFGGCYQVDYIITVNRNIGG